LKKLVFIILLISLMVTSLTVVEAKPVEVNQRKEIQETVRSGREAGIKERNEEREQEREEVGPTGTPALSRIQKLKQQILERLRARFPRLLPAGFNRGEIISLSGITFPATVKVKHEGGEVTLKVTDKTKILRRIGGKASLSELKIGDIVSGRGVWEDDARAILDTRVLRDLSVEKRQGTFWGLVKSLGNDSLVFEVKNKGEIKVYVGSSTKIVDRQGKEIRFSDLKVNHRIRVTGLWDNSLKQVEAVKLIKDWSTGAIVQSPTPTLTPIPTGGVNQ
jgi:hypothetical protein